MICLPLWEVGFANSLNKQQTVLTVDDFGQGQTLLKIHRRRGRDGGRQGLFLQTPVKVPRLAPPRRKVKRLPQSWFSPLEQRGIEQLFALIWSSPDVRYT